MYSKYPFTTLLVASGLKEFTVLDVVPVNEQYGKNKDDSRNICWQILRSFDLMTLVSLIPAVLFVHISETSFKPAIWC